MSKRAGARRLGVVIAATAVAGLMALFLGGTARAASTCSATTTAQFVTCVTGSGAGDTVLLKGGVSFALTQSLDITHNLTIKTDPATLASRGATIVGPSANPSSVDPGQLDIFAVGAGAALTLQNVVLTAAIQPANGAVAVTNGGSVTIDHSLLSGNSAPGVDVMQGGQLTMTNSTISGTIGFDGIILDGTATLNEDTIADNDQHGINNHGGGTANVNNTLLTRNATGNCFFAIGSASGPGTFSNDADSAATCGFGSTNGSFSNTGTTLIAANTANNGGPTNTYALTAAPNVAIDHGTGPGAASTDQRGLVRDAAPDIGAYELNAVAPVAVSLTVIKHVDNTGCTTNCASASDFTMTVTDTTTGAVIASFPGSEAPGHAPVAIPAGDSWSVTESGAQTPNYNAVASAGCTGSATSNGTASCTITNTFIVGACAQPTNPASANTCVTANVAATIIVTAPTSISFPSLGAGESSSPIAVPVNVKSNNGDGYQLSAIRTAFTNGDIPLSIGSGAVTDPPEVLDLPNSNGGLGPTSSPTPIPTSGPNLNIGHSGTVTTNAGDDWPFTFVLGPIPFNVPAGQHQSVVTFTAVAIP
jgi:hypothetical protein